MDDGGGEYERTIRTVATHSPLGGRSRSDGGARTAGRVSESVPVMSTESSPESELSEPVEGETGRAIDFE